MPVTEIHFELWVIGLIIDFATPNTAGKLHSKFAPNISHLPERMGLFTLIVLGESIVDIVTGLTETFIICYLFYSLIENTKTTRIDL